jgi:hypothetical protein
LGNDTNRVLYEIRDSLRDIAANTKKEKKKPDYILICAWIAIGIVALYMIWKIYRTFV